ncbi:cytochrome c biogenesis protein CcdA [Lysinibacter cavernae]|uniref:Cytochrome c biogenesis protein CcdA n=1 Tax=Lysinibacter cavernae TaxID=1640652 RepID=A0A7X5TTX0_9MICO|nr:cytochrome c biogenesis protein CcdA [Lysinibacter cavernae]
MDIGYAGAFLGGILTLLSPCSVMLLPAFFAYAFASPTKLLSRTALFYAGLVTTLVPLGVLAGVLGSFVTQQRHILVTAAAILVIVIGLLQVAGVNIPGFRRGSAGEGTSAISVFVLGTVYGVAGVCAGPILGSVLTLAAVGGNPVYGGLMLAIFALGMTVPLGILSLLWGRFNLGSRSWLKPRRITIGKWSNSVWMLVAGLLSIGIGILLLATDGTSSFGGILTADSQFRAESWAVEATSQVSNLWFVLGAAVLLGAGAGIYALRARSRARAKA